MAAAASSAHRMQHIHFSETREQDQQLGCNSINDISASATIRTRDVDIDYDIDFSESPELSHQLGCNRLNDATASTTSDIDFSEYGERSNHLGYNRLNDFTASTTITRSGVNEADIDKLIDAFPSTSTSLSARWRDIQGANQWKGLLDPIDPVLKGEILRYGDFAQACYDGFNNDTYSKYCGDCKYIKTRLLQKVGVQCAADYEVTKYLYSTNSNISIQNFFHSSRTTAESWSGDLNWVGFVAVSNSTSEIQRLGRREIVIAWRGTVTTTDWISDLQDWLIPAAMCPGETAQRFSDVKVEIGFRSIYTTKNESSRRIKESAEEQLLVEMRKLLMKYKGEKLSITVTGHSLGGALALLSAYSIAESGMLTRPISRTANSGDHFKENFDPDQADGSRDSDATQESDLPITVVTFAGPRVGNDDFCDRCKELGIRTLRVVNEKDVVPKVPGVMLNENNLHVLGSWVEKLPWTYSHVGVELALNTDDSPYIDRNFWDVACHHNLELYLHLLDAYHGKQKRFSYSGHRDLALVNKHTELLKTECCVPPNWWQQENKGLVRNSEGRWVEPDREEEDEDGTS